MKRLLALLAAAFFISCSSTPGVKSQAYAPLREHRTFEYELPIVWKGIEETFKNHKIVSRDPDEVDPMEMKTLEERSLETDWIYSQSRDKYQEYRVNDLPRKRYLQTRYKYEITARRTLGGTEVWVRPTEEIEILKSDGSSAGYESAKPDPTRGNEIIEKINLSILSAAP